MKLVRVPEQVLAFEITAGHVTLQGSVNAPAFGGIGAVVDAVAREGLEKAAAAIAAPHGLRFPPSCCNCLTEKGRMRSIESTSIVNRGVAYAFRLAIPHCGGCAKTANRKRPGFMGRLAAFLAIAVPIAIVMFGFGAATNQDRLIYGSLVAGPLAGFLLPLAWIQSRRPRDGQTSYYQAVYASSVDVSMAGVPKGFDLAFANGTYAQRFVAANKDLGVTAARGSA